MPGRLEATQPHILPYPVWRADVYHFSGDYIEIKTKVEQIMRKKTSAAEKESRNSVALSISLVEFYSEGQV